MIQYVKSQVEDVEYAGDVINTIEKGNLSQGGKDDDGDELLQEAIDCVVTAGQASVSIFAEKISDRLQQSRPHCGYDGGKEALWVRRTGKPSAAGSAYGR